MALSLSGIALIIAIMISIIGIRAFMVGVINLQRANIEKEYFDRHRELVNEYYGYILINPKDIIDGSVLHLDRVYNAIASQIPNFRQIEMSNRVFWFSAILQDMGKMENPSVVILDDVATIHETLSSYLFDPSTSKLASDYQQFYHENITTDRELFDFNSGDDDGDANGYL